MNKDRRKQLDEALKLLDEADALAQQAFEIVEAVRDEEEEAYDNLPESLQQGERGENMQSAICSLENIDLESVFDDARSYIEEAQSV